MAEKKGLLYRLTMGRDDNPDFDVSRLPGTRWAVFKDVLFSRFGALVKINLLTILFCLPAIAWVALNIMRNYVVDSWINYTGNFGFSFDATASAVMQGNVFGMMSTMMTFSILIPCLMIASIGFAGAFHTMKLLVWGEGVSVGSTFFRGIKANFFPFLWGSLLLGVGIFLVAFNFAAQKVNEASTFLNVMASVSSILLLVLLVFMSLFMFTQGVTYKLKFWGLVRNSFLLSIGMIFQNIFFVGITAIPIVLTMVLPMQISLFFFLFYILCGISMTILIWTVYAHYVFDKYINDRVDGAIKDRGVYRKSKEELERKRNEAAERRKKAANTRFANPKKRKPTTSIEDGSHVTPLATTFSRRDLERLAEEKKVVKEEVDREYEEDDVFDEVDSSDSAERGEKTAVAQKKDDKQASADKSAKSGSKQSK